MHAMTDYLPDNRELWIRKLSGSPDLGIYDYNATADAENLDADLRHGGHDQRDAIGAA